jgi:hypothetical protein
MESHRCSGRIRWLPPNQDSNVPGRVGQWDRRIYDVGSSQSRFSGHKGTRSRRIRSKQMVRAILARKLSIIGLFLIIGTVASVVLVSWRQPLRISTTKLLIPIPKPPPLKPVSIAYKATLPTMWHLENCSPPGAGYLGFKGTATEYQSYERNPTLSFAINRRGTIDEVRLMRTSGSSVLDQRILTWIHQLRFAVQKGCELPWQANGFVNVEF